MGNRLGKRSTIKKSVSTANLSASNGHMAVIDRNNTSPVRQVPGLPHPATPPRVSAQSRQVSEISTPTTPSTSRLRVGHRPDGLPVTPNISHSRITLTPSTPDLRSKPMPLGTQMVAVYTYESRQEDELSFSKGDAMEVVGDSENCDWWLVKHQASGKTGYIPRNYVELGSNQVRIQDWWCPLDRGDAERTLLNPELGRGTFLIRERQDNVYPYALSVKDYDGSKVDYTVKHYKIRTAGSGWYITHTHIFSSVPKLVSYYSEHDSSGLCCLLKTPCPKKKPFVPFREMEVSRNHVKLIRKMGNGYFGEVWMGKMGNNEDVAVKMMKEGKMSTQNFIKEARVLHNLRHRKLVPLRGVCTKSRPMMIITELMPRGDLLKYLHSDIGKRLKIQHLVDMASQIASGMSYLEKCNYIHRDLRAANVLVGENNVVKIADFGLARLVLNEDDVYIMTNHSKVPIKWTAPEALLRREFSIKSDVWSFGILLYEIFTYGRIPYPCTTSAQLLPMLQQGYRMPKPNNFPDQVFTIMQICWEELPENRPAFTFLHSVFDDYIVATENSYRERGT